MDPGSSLADSFHIESHAALLQRTVATESSRKSLDAIVVPTIRPAALQAAVDLAGEAHCLLVVLCTTEEQASQALSFERADSDTFITHVPPGIMDSQLDFMTSGHPEVEIEFTCHIDIARKRNVGLLLARLCGWRTVMYLDDDIRSLTALAVTRAASLTEHFQTVGFEISHYPDNSVVCHAHRLAGGEQSVFPGGSAMLVDVSQSDSFFPPVYNEDWLFLFDAVQSRSLAVADNLTQLEYQPFAHARRAASEEFGDLIAEGLYRLIHEGGRVADATLDYWQAALRRRAQLIDDIATRLLLRDEDQPLVGPALMSLAAARKRLDAITAVGCVSFIRAWRSDLGNWRSRLLSLPMPGDIRDAAKFIQLPVMQARVTR